MQTLFPAYTLDIPMCYIEYVIELDIRASTPATEINDRKSLTLENYNSKIMTWHYAGKSNSNTCRNKTRKRSNCESIAT